MAGTASAPAGDVPETRTIDVDLRVGRINVIRLNNGYELHVEPFRKSGRMGITIYDAATGCPIQTIPGKIPRKPALKKSRK